MSRSTHASSSFPALALSALIGALTLSATRAAAEPVLLRPQYRLSASIAPGQPQVEGTVDIAFTNRSARTLDHVVLWLFPNRFAEPDAWMNDFYRAYVYPDKEFHPGSLQLLELRDGDRATVAIPEPVPDLPPGTAVPEPTSLAVLGNTRISGRTAPAARSRSYTSITFWPPRAASSCGLTHSRSWPRSQNSAGARWPGARSGGR